MNVMGKFFNYRKTILIFAGLLCSFFIGLVPYDSYASTLQSLLKGHTVLNPSKESGWDSRPQGNVNFTDNLYGPFSFNDIDIRYMSKVFCAYQSTDSYILPDANTIKLYTNCLVYDGGIINGVIGDKALFYNYNNGSNVYDFNAFPYVSIVFDATPGSFSDGSDEKEFFYGKGSSIDSFSAIETPSGKEITVTDSGITYNDFTFSGWTKDSRVSLLGNNTIYTNLGAVYTNQTLYATYQSQKYKGSSDSCYNTDGMNGWGWVACPGINFVAGIIDAIVGGITSGLSLNLLIEDPTKYEGGGNLSAVAAVWGNILPIANIALVIVFLIIIYSTATSIGLSNYNVKKMLPRLIVVAIAVNISFYTCAALADVFNIVGNGAKDLISSWLPTPDKPQGFGDFASGIALAAVLILALILCFAGAVLALITILTVVAMRQVVLIVLVIISPIAIVLYLLPNTEKWFKSWLNNYVRMLFVYPFFMVAWAGTRLVTVILGSATLGGSEFWKWVFMSLLNIAPLFIILPIFRMSGGLMSKMTDMVNKAVQNNGLANRLKDLNKETNANIGAKATAGFDRLRNSMTAKGQENENKITEDEKRLGDYNKFRNSYNNLQKDADELEQQGKTTEANAKRAEAKQLLDNYKSEIGGDAQFVEESKFYNDNKDRNFDRERSRNRAKNQTGLGRFGSLGYGATRLATGEAFRQWSASNKDWRENMENERGDVTKARAMANDAQKVLDDPNATDEDKARARETLASTNATLASINRGRVQASKPNFMMTGSTVVPASIAAKQRQENANKAFENASNAYRQIQGNDGFITNERLNLEGQSIEQRGKQILGTAKLEDGALRVADQQVKVETKSTSAVDAQVEALAAEDVLRNVGGMLDSEKTAKAAATRKATVENAVTMEYATDVKEGTTTISGQSLANYSGAVDLATGPNAISGLHDTTTKTMTEMTGKATAYQTLDAAESTRQKNAVVYLNNNQTEAKTIFTDAKKAKDAVLMNAVIEQKTSIAQHGEAAEFFNEIANDSNIMSDPEIVRKLVSGNMGNAEFRKNNPWAANYLKIVAGAANQADPGTSITVESYNDAMANNPKIFAGLGASAWVDADYDVLEYNAKLDNDAAKKAFMDEALKYADSVIANGGKENQDKMLLDIIAPTQKARPGDGQKAMAKSFSPSLGDKLSTAKLKIIFGEGSFVDALSNESSRKKFSESGTTVNLQAIDVKNYNDLPEEYKGMLRDLATWVNNPNHSGYDSDVENFVLQKLADAGYSKNPNTGKIERIAPPPP